MNNSETSKQNHLIIQGLNLVISLANIILCYYILSLDLGDKVLSDMEACKISLIDNPIDMTRCQKCDGWVQNTSIHCEKCNKCVAGFDHHCTWLNSCIAKKNFRAFFAFLCAYLVHSFLMIFASVYSLVQLRELRHKLEFVIIVCWMVISVVVTAVELVKVVWTIT